MDAVELPLPAPVAVPKHMGSEGFGRVGVSVKGVEAREKDRVSVLVGPPIERCSSLVGHKGLFPCLLLYQWFVLISV